MLTSKIITCHQARRAHDRAMIASGSRSLSFRAWARQEYRKRSASELSPKLARVVLGEADR